MWLHSAAALACGASLLAAADRAMLSERVVEHVLAGGVHLVDPSLLGSGPLLLAPGLHIAC